MAGAGGNKHGNVFPLSLQKDQQKQFQIPNWVYPVFQMASVEQNVEDLFPIAISEELWHRYSYHLKRLIIPEACTLPPSKSKHLRPWKKYNTIQQRGRDQFYIIRSYSFIHWNFSRPKGWYAPRTRLILIDLFESR